MPSEGETARLAFRLILPVAAARAAAEGLDLHLTFIAPLVAAAFALQPTLSFAAVLVIPLAGWLLVWIVAVLHEGFATTALPAYLVITYAGLYVGFQLCQAGGARMVFGYLTLIVFAVTPMQFMQVPQAADIVANDVGRNVLIGAACAWIACLFLRGPDPAGRADGGAGRPVAPLSPGIAASVTTLAAFLTWVLEPPSSGSLLISIIIVLRAGNATGLAAGRDRLLAALLGGLAAVLAASLVSLAYVLPVLFLAVLAMGWPFAWWTVRPGPWRDLAAKSLNVLVLLVAEGFSPLFTDAEDRLWVRLAGIVLGVAYASLCIALFARGRPRPVGRLPGTVPGAAPVHPSAGRGRIGPGRS